MFLSIVIPAYNESQVIQDTINKINKYLKIKELLDTSEIIVVNDGSVDDTLEIINKSAASNLKIINLKKNLGKGAAVKMGVLAAKGDMILFMDADFSTPIEELDNFLPKLSNGYDIIIGSRGLRNSKILVSQSNFKVMCGRLGNKLIQLLAVPGIKDTQCGFKLFTKKCLPIFKKQTLSGWGFDFELLFLANYLNFKILELPVVWANRRKSRVKFFDYFKTLIELATIRINYYKGIYEKN